MQTPEAQLFLYNLLLMKLLDAGDYENSKQFGDFVYLRMKDVNLRTMDYFAAKSLYLIGLAYEKNGVLTSVQPMMFEAFKSASLRLDYIGQATIINIIIRSYMQQNLYE